MTVRLTAAALIRSSVVHSYGLKSHAQIRNRLGDEDPYTHTPGDEEGFLDSEERFHTRRAAVQIGVASGQLTPDWLYVGRELLSSDINWDAAVKGHTQSREAKKVEQKAAVSRQLRRAKERKEAKRAARGAGRR